MSRKWVTLVDPNKCTGCRTCEVSCSLAHEKDIINPFLARIRVQKDEEAGRDTPKTCRQCRNAPCAQACPQGAINFQAVLGAWVVDEDRCNGCGACVEACPFDCIFLHPGRQVAVKCDLCGGEPRCVRECSQQALSLRE